MKKWLILLLALGLLGAAFYLFTFEWMVPRLASISLPMRLHRLPVRQPRNIMLDYLGTPKSTDSSARTDEWIWPAGKQAYRLEAGFGQDSLLIRYRIEYRYRNFLFHKTYLLDSFSVR